MKGYRTIAIGAAMVVLPPLLTYLAGITWSDYVSPAVAVAISGAIMVALRVVTTTPIGGTIDKTIVKILLGAFLVSLFCAPRAEAADVSGPSAISKAMTAGYPTKCGYYYGIGTGGNAGAVNGAAVGTQIVQGDIDAIVGYTCPFAQNAFWFAEGSFGFSNLNGSSNGIALSGPLVFIQRAGVGSPINALLSGILPGGLSSPALPSVPLLPANLTTSPGNPYAFAGIVEQDIGAQIGALSGHQWVVSPLLGLGMLTRVSNGVMVDTWAGWQMNSNSFCPGGGTACAKLGNMARVGVSLKY